MANVSGVGAPVVSGTSVNEEQEGPSLWQVYYTPENIPYYFNAVSRHTQWEHPQPPKEYLDANGPPPLIRSPMLAGSGGRNYGPIGSNLFIFHLPGSWTDSDLRQHFNAFGNVVSSRIQTDSTGRNSGFGFVSYDSPASAQAAIRVLNGFGVCGKFLKVQLKKGEEISTAVPPSGTEEKPQENASYGTNNNNNNNINNNNNNRPANNYPQPPPQAPHF